MKMFYLRRKGIPGITAGQISERNSCWTYKWSRGQIEICGLFWEFVAPPGKRNLVAIMAQRHVLET